MAELRVTSAVVTVVMILGAYMARGKAECIVNIRSDLGYKSPLIMTTENTAVLGGTGFLLPSASSPIASLYNGEEVALLCAGSNNRLNISGTASQLKEANVQCDAGLSFQHSGQYLPVTDFQCTAVPQSTIRENGTCSSGQKRLQIGYEMSSDSFIRLIDTCFDDVNYSTHYANYTLANGIQRRQVFEHGSDVDRVDYYSSLPNSPDVHYTCSNQRRTVGELVGSSNVDRYIKCSDNINYVAKAHLAAVSDFVYFAQQESTKHHVNVVPMWYSIKNGNWLNLEEEIRQYASNTSRDASDLVIYSGTFGVTNLDNHRLYLGRDSNDMNVIPVPQWVWKLVYEPTEKEGIVFLVVNNPYRSSFACSCVCAQTQWTLAWNRRDAYKGYVYCCTVNNFRSVFSGLPTFEVTGLLTKNRPYTPLFPDVPAQ